MIKYHFPIPHVQNWRTQNCMAKMWDYGCLKMWDYGCLKMWEVGHHGCLKMREVGLWGPTKYGKWDFEDAVSPPPYTSIASGEKIAGTIKITWARLCIL